MALDFTKLERWTGLAWVEETEVLGIQHRDVITEVRQSIVTIADPQRTVQSNYSIFQRVRLTERETEQILMYGRVESKDAQYDRNYGRVLNLVIHDFLQIFKDRNIDTDYSGSFTLRSALVSQIVTDHETPVATFSKNINASVRTGDLKLDYSNASISAFKAIWEIARQDPHQVGGAITRSGYDFRQNDVVGVPGTPVFRYFQRGALPTGGPVTNGLTVELHATETPQKLAMFEDASFQRHGPEVVTRVHVQHQVEDVDGNRTFATTTRPAALPSALETSLNIIKEETIYRPDVLSVAEATDIADTHLAQRADNAILRGTFSVSGYPRYTITATNFVVRAGDLIRVINSDEGINQDMLVLEISYTEPPGVATLDVVAQDKSYGIFKPGPMQMARGAEDRAQFAIWPSLASIAVTQNSITTNLLSKGALPFNTDILFSGTGTWNAFQWTAGTLEFADGTSQAINSGSQTGLTASTTYWVYAVVDPASATLGFSSIYSDAVGNDRVLLAVVVIDTTSGSDEPTILPFTGKQPTLAATVLAANLVLSTNIISGAIGAGRWEITPTQIAGFNGSNIQQVKLINTGADAGCIVTGNDEVKLCADGLKFRSAGIEIGRIFADISALRLSAIGLNNDLVVDLSGGGTHALRPFGTQNITLGGNNAFEGWRGLYLKDHVANPTVNGEFRRNGADVYVYSGGAARNLSSTGGGGGAPTTARYLTLAIDATLTQERVFTPGNQLSAVDSGAGAAYTLNVTTTPFFNTITSINEIFIGTHLSSPTYISMVALTTAPVGRNEGDFWYLNSADRIQLRGPSSDFDIMKLQDLSAVDRNVLPGVTSTYDIGSSSAVFRGVHAEAYRTYSTAGVLVGILSEVVGDLWLNSPAALIPADIEIRAGSSTGGANKGANVIIRPGNGAVGGTDGNVVIRDADDVNNVLMVNGREIFIGNGVGASVVLPKVTIRRDAGQSTDDYLELKHASVAHGMTGQADTDTFGVIEAAFGTFGGVRLTGLSESIVGLRLKSNATTSNTGKTTGNEGALVINAALKSGTGITTFGANANLVVIRNNTTTRFIFDADGDGHADVSWTTFDDYPDWQIAGAITSLLAPQSRGYFKETAEKYRSIIEQHKLVTYNDDGHHFVNFTKMPLFCLDAIFQMGQHVFLDHDSQIAELQQENNQLRTRIDRLESLLTL